MLSSLRWTPCRYRASSTIPFALPIKAEDVLDPVKVEIDPGCEIIDARILKISRAVTGFAKGQVSDTAKNELPLSFRILEHNDGAQLQIIYTGKPDAHVSLAGTIVGAGEPREAEADADQLQRPGTSRFWPLTLVTLAAVALLLVPLHITTRAAELILTVMPFGVQLPAKSTMTALGGAVRIFLLGALIGFTSLSVFASARRAEVIPSTIQTDR